MKPVVQSNARCESSVSNGALTFELAGRLDSAGVAKLWPLVHRELEEKKLSAITVEGSGVTYCDGTGAALLVFVRRTARRMGLKAEFRGLNTKVANMLALYPAETISISPKEDKRNGIDFVEKVGETVVQGVMGLRDHVTFLGEVVVGLFKAAARPAGIRMKDLLTVVEASGPRALPIIGMLGFLIGLIIAFQGAVLMKQFGAEIYIADSAGLLMTRELGPLITAIIVAGRTGSAFAAEIGTMKVNEEIDAFTTMGLDPVRFLVIPRVIAASVMTPMLAVFANLFGLAGGALVMLGLGYPLVTYVNRVIAVLGPFDYLSGLLKALVFGFLIAASGCMCGLRTGDGASAVGDSATRAVVSSIMLVIIADGVFAVLFYYLGI